MTQENETITENYPTNNEPNETPSQPYRVTMEVPLFLTMLSVSLSGKLL